MNKQTTVWIVVLAIVAGIAFGVPIGITWQRNHPVWQDSAAAQGQEPVMLAWPSIEVMGEVATMGSPDHKVMTAIVTYHERDYVLVVTDHGIAGTAVAITPVLSRGLQPEVEK